MSSPRPAATVSALVRLAVRFRRDLTAALAEQDWAGSADVSPPMYGVLRTVDRRPGSSQREIADALLLDPSDLADVLDRMGTNGWIRRERDPSDRRRLLVHLTEPGRDALVRFDEVAARVEDDVLAALRPGERRMLASLLTRALEPPTGPPR